MRILSFVGACALMLGVPALVSAQGQKFAYVNSAAILQSAPGRAEAEALATALADHNRMAARDADGLAVLRQADARPVRVVPLMPEDVHDLEGLSRVGRALMQNFSSADTF